MGLVFLQSDTAVFLILGFVFIAAIALIIPVVVVMVFWIKRRERRSGIEWAITAHQVGLQLRVAGPENLSDLDQARTWFGRDVKVTGPSTTQVMFGCFANREVEVWIRQVRTSGYTIYDSSTMIQKKKYFTCCSARVMNRSGYEFSLKSTNAEGFFTSALNTEPSLAVGFPPFDQNYRASANAPHALFSVLSARMDDGTAAAERFAALLNRGWTIQATGNEVRIEYPGMVLDPAQIGTALRASTELASRLEWGLARL